MHIEKQYSKINIKQALIECLLQQYIKLVRSYKDDASVHAMKMLLISYDVCCVMIAQLYASTSAILLALCLCFHQYALACSYAVMSFCLYLSCSLIVVKLSNSLSNCLPIYLYIYCYKLLNLPCISLLNKEAHRGLLRDFL